jgi:type I restriction enzyme S subunit
MKNSWIQCSLGDICEISTGKSNTEDAVENGEFAFFDRSKTVKRSSKYLFDCDAIIVAGEGQTFLPKFYSGKFDLHQRAYAIFNFDESASIHYVYKYLIHFHKYFERVAVGATAKSLRLRHFQDLPIPLPPLHEQQRIVAILDEAFAAIAKAKANAEQNLKNAKELFGSYLKGVFEKRGDSWKERVLEDLVDERCSLSYGIVQPGEDYPEGLPVVRPTDLTHRFVRLDGLKRIDPKLASAYKRTTLIGDEMLLCVRGSTGVVSIATSELKNGNVTRGIVPIRFNPKVINQDFGYYLLISNYVQRQIQAKTYGTALMQINIGDLRKISAPFPPINEQLGLVRHLDILRAYTRKLETIYIKKIEDLEELKQSILQKAFAGRLTDKVEVDLIRQGTNNQLSI